MGDTAASHVQCVAACKGVRVHEHVCANKTVAVTGALGRKPGTWAEAWRSTGEARAAAASRVCLHEFQGREAEGRQETSPQAESGGIFVSRSVDLLRAGQTGSASGLWALHVCQQTQLCTHHTDAATDVCGQVTVPVQLWAQEPRAAQTWPGTQPANPDLTLKGPRAPCRIH